MPVEVKTVFLQASVKDKPRALGLRLKQQLYLGVMAQWLEMPNAYRFLGNLFFVKYLARVKLAIYRKTLGYQSLEQVYLNVAHKTGFYLPQLLVTVKVKRRFFFLKLLELGKVKNGVAAVRQNYAVG